MPLCGSCGERVAAGKKFCTECGAPLTALDNLPREKRAAGTTRRPVPSRGGGRGVISTSPATATSRAGRERPSWNDGDDFDGEPTVDDERLYGSRQIQERHRPGSSLGGASGGVRGAVRAGGVSSGASPSPLQFFGDLPPLAHPHLTDRFIDGPLNPSGTRVVVSERPATCLSVFGDEAAIGISDHGLWTMSISACRAAGDTNAFSSRSRDAPGSPLRRELYTKRHGHTDWVTCVTHTPDGRVLSGGMDSKICLWSKGGSTASCIDLLGHEASVSVLVCGRDQATAAPSRAGTRRITGRAGQTAAPSSIGSTPIPLRGPLGVALSGSYDGSVCLWDVNTGSRSSSPIDRLLLSGPASVTDPDGLKSRRAAAITAAKWVTLSSYDGSDTNGGGDCAFCAGDRSGFATFVSVSAGRAGASATVRWAAHRGAVTSMCAVDTLGFGGAAAGGDMVATGGEDGFVRVWDARAPGKGNSSAAGAGKSGPLCVMQARPHANASGVGAVTALVQGGGSCGYMASAGADGTASVYDPRMSFKSVHTLEFPSSFVYSADAVGDYLALGSGDTDVYMYQMSTGRLLYGLGAVEKGAVRAVKIVPGALVCAGDDGSAMVYAFE